MRGGIWWNTRQVENGMNSFYALNFRGEGQVPPGNHGNALEQSEPSAPIQVTPMWDSNRPVTCATWNVAYKQHRVRHQRNRECWVPPGEIPARWKTAQTLSTLCIVEA
jgi:hypothetical protein